MPEPAGRLSGPKKWLVARYPAPPGKLIFLGSILTNPEDPETSLNRKTGAIPIPEEDRLDQSDAVRGQIQSKLSADASMLLHAVPPNSPLFNAGLEVQGLSSHEIETKVEAMNVKAEVFLPSAQYIQEALEQPEIVSYAKSCLWRMPLYMIIGVATADRLSITEQQSRERLASTSAQLSITGTGIDFAAGPSWKRTAQDGSNLETASTTDFAYRIRQLRYSKYRKHKDKGDRTEGTMLLDRQNKSSSSMEGSELPMFDEWGEEDIGHPDLFALTMEDS